MEYPELLTSLALLQSDLATVVPKLAAKTVELKELEQLKETIDTVRSTLWITFLTEERRARSEEETFARVLVRARIKRVRSMLRGVRQDIIDGRVKLDDPDLLYLQQTVEDSMWTFVRILGAAKAAR